MFNSKDKKSSKPAPVETSPVSTVISADVQVLGDIIGENSIKIDGKVKGNIEIKKSVILGKNSTVEGNIESNSAVIYGKVTGNITAKNTVLKNMGRVEGDIDTHTIEIEAGGVCNGKLMMQQKEEESANDKKAKKPSFKKAV